MAGPFNRGDTIINKHFTTMPNLSDLVSVHSGQVRNFNLLAWDKYKEILVSTIPSLIHVFCLL